MFLLAWQKHMVQNKIQTINVKFCSSICCLYNATAITTESDVIKVQHEG